MKTKLRNIWHWFACRLPEVLLVLFLVMLAPLAVLIVREACRQSVAFLEMPKEYLATVRANLGTVAATVVCLVGTVLMVLMLLKNWSFIWAVARKMIIEAMHRKMVVVLLLFFVVLMPSLPFVLKTEGTLKSQAQIVLLYSLVLALALLSLLAIFVATASICSEVERKYVHITDTKPLRRWQFLFGKWFGILILCTGALCVMTVATLFLVQYLVRSPDYAKMEGGAAGKAMLERQKIAQELFVARRSVHPPLPDVSKELEEELRQWRKANVKGGVHSFRQRTEKELRAGKWAVRALSAIEWKFEDLLPQSEGVLHMRFKVYASTAIMRGRYIIGRWQLVQSEDSNAEPAYGVVPVHAVYPPASGWASSAFHEVALPAGVIGPDGTLYLRYENTDQRCNVFFDVDDPIEIMQRAEGFLGNYYRSVLVVFFQIGLLAALGLMAGSLFSFPVASLTVLCFFVGGLIGPWFSRYIEPDIYKFLTPLTEQLDALWRGFCAIVLAMMPNFGSFSPFDSLVNGRLVGMDHVALAGAVLFFVKGGLALLIGFYFYNRRELAQVIV